MWYLVYVKSNLGQKLNLSICNFFLLVVYIDPEGIRVIYLPRESGLYTSRGNPGYIPPEGIRVIYLPRGFGLYTSVRMRPQKPRLRHRRCGTIKIPSGSEVIDNDQIAGITVTVTSTFECNIFMRNVEE